MSRYIRVMVIDNEKSTFSRLKKMNAFSENGFTIEAFSSGSTDAVKALKSGSIDLVIVCNKSPALSAPTVIKKIGERCGGVPFIVISPQNDTKSMRDCFILGAVDFLVEPVDEENLSNALDRVRKQMGVSLMNSEYELAAEEYFSVLEETVSDKKFLGELKAFILSCENTTATTEYAADYFGFNKDYFGRMFKSKLGMTFGDFYKHFRIRYAERMLSSGRFKVYEVSEMLGFASVDYFTSVFKKITGKKPSELKK